MLSRISRAFHHKHKHKHPERSCPPFDARGLSSTSAHDGGADGSSAPPGERPADRALRGAGDGPTLRLHCVTWNVNGKLLTDASELESLVPRAAIFGDEGADGGGGGGCGADGDGSDATSRSSGDRGADVVVVGLQEAVHRATPRVRRLREHGAS
jgi:hypothetical protein